MRTSGGIIIGIIVMLSFTRPANADFTVCNETTAGSLEVAAAYNYDSLDSTDSWSRSEGFWTIAQGECSTTLTGITSGDSLYLFAWASSDQSQTWSGTSNYSAVAMDFCVDGQSSAFLYKGSAATPSCTTGVPRKFRYAGVADDAGDLTYRLGD